MNGFWLKVIALAAMLADHIGAVFFGGAAVSAFGNDWEILRIIGRIAFPILAYQIAEGAGHTSNWRRYALRLLLFGLLSEIPFDLALSGALTLEKQNVYFTLFLGLLAIRADMYFVRRDISSGRGKGILVAAVCMAAGWVIRCDYGFFGVLLVYWFYLTHSEPMMMALGTAAVEFSMGGLQPFGLLGLIPISFYNHQRGYHGKWIQYGFYLFYPLHLLIIGGIRWLI